MDILARLNELSEPGYRAFSRKMIPTENEILGVRAPHLAALSREVLRGDFRAFLETAPDDILEVLLLKAAALGGGGMELGERLDRVRAFLPKIDNWAVCDSLMGALEPKSSEREAYFEFLSPFFEDGREFYARFAAVMMIHYAKPDWIARATGALVRVRQKDYYAVMGVAWALSHLYVTFPGEVEALLRENALDDKTHNTTIRKIVESRRVDENAKTALKALRRRGR